MPSFKQYEPLKQSIQGFPSWVYGVEPIPFKESLSQWETLQNQELVNDKGELEIAKEKKRQDQQKELADVFNENENQSFDELLPEVENVLGKYGDVGAVLDMRGKRASAQSKAQRDEFNDILKIAKYDPEVASQMWDQSSLAGSKPKPNFQKKGSGDAATTKYYDDEGKLVMELPKGGKMMPGQKTPNQQLQVWYNSNGEARRVNVKDSEQFDTAISEGFYPSIIDAKMAGRTQGSTPATTPTPSPAVTPRVLVRRKVQ